MIPRLADPALIPRDFTTSEEVNEVYRRRARFFDWSVNAYYLIGFRWWAYRHRAVAALQLQPGATVVEGGIGCGAPPQNSGAAMGTSLTRRKVP